MMVKEEIKRPIKYVYTTTVTGLLFMIPLVIILVVVVKLGIYLIGLLSQVSVSIKNITGVADLQFWVWIVLVAIGLFFAGLVFKIHIIRKTVGRIEDRILSLFPGYRMMKSLARSAESSEDQLMKPALVHEEEIWQPCFLIEEHNELATVFIPEAPNVGNGEIKVCHKANVHPLPITNFQMIVIIRDYGLGLTQWIDENKIALAKEIRTN